MASQKKGLVHDVKGGGGMRIREKGKTDHVLLWPKESDRERRHVKRRDRIERCDRDWTVTSSRVYVCVVSV